VQRDLPAPVLKVLDFRELGRGGISKRIGKGLIARVDGVRWWLDQVWHLLCELYTVDDRQGVRRLCRRGNIFIVEKFALAVNGIVYFTLIILTQKTRRYNKASSLKR